jgi:hypothetical protein
MRGDDRPILRWYSTLDRLLDETDASLLAHRPSVVRWKVRSVHLSVPRWRDDAGPDGPLMDWLTRRSGLTLGEPREASVPGRGTLLTALG